MGGRGVTVDAWYSVPEVCEESKYRIELTGDWCLDRPTEQADIAERAAKHYWAFHDGWECSWPIEINLFASEDGPRVARLSVDMDFRPVYSAIHIVD